IYLNKKLKMKLDSEVITKPLAACLCMTLALVAINALFVNVSRSTIGALIEITVAVVVYFAVALLLKIFDRKELGLSVKS
ncbi:MAG: polysaccharide biosynthesis C-terminal domain-containing protein, partial [Clostridia bacterium]